jgi:hypothetical protein
LEWQELQQMMQNVFGTLNVICSPLTESKHGSKSNSCLRHLQSVKTGCKKQSAPENSLVDERQTFCFGNGVGKCLMSGAPTTVTFLCSGGAKWRHHFVFFRSTCFSQAISNQSMGNSIDSRIVSYEQLQVDLEAANRMAMLFSHPSDLSHLSFLCVTLESSSIPSWMTFWWKHVVAINVQWVYK